LKKIAVKDIKLRTFISQDEGRDDLVGHVYDITYDTVRKGSDKLVIIDDSIVRGTTLKQSIIKILDRLNPVTIVIVPPHHRSVILIAMNRHGQII